MFVTMEMGVWLNNYSIYSIFHSETHFTLWKDKFDYQVTA